jgi:hypothetical protein
MTDSGLTRRGFLVRSLSGFAVSLCAAAGTVSLLKWNFGSTHEKQVLSTKHRKAVRLKGERRKRYRAKDVWTLSALVLNKRTGVLHWPHPKLFRDRNAVKARNAEVHPVLEWRTILGSNADLECRRGNDGKLRFDCRRDGRIREALALMTISFGPDGALKDIEDALTILKPALRYRDESRSWRKPRQLFGPPKGNWRMYVLYAKLTCLANESSHLRAYREIHLAFGEEALIAVAEYIARNQKRMAVDVSTKESERVLWNGGIEGFRKWHGKVVGGPGSKRSLKNDLACRIVEAKLLVEGASSSGKDTQTGEESSNLSAHLHCHPHRRSFASKLRRYWKKKIENFSKRFEPSKSKRATREMRSFLRRRISL